jgi:hypothetical protein
MGFVQGWEWAYIQVDVLYARFLLKLFVVAKAVSSNQRRGPTSDALFAKVSRGNSG